MNLYKHLEKVDGIERYRISSIEPNLLTNDIIEFVAQQQKIHAAFSYSFAKWKQQDFRLNAQKI